MVTKTRYDIMGMHITISIVDGQANEEDVANVFSFFQDVDSQFSTYKKDSEISRLNRGELREKDVSQEMQHILRLCVQTKKQTNGYFDIHQTDGTRDPSGLVKGWAIFEAARKLQKRGLHNFYLDAGGDIQTAGLSSRGTTWRVGIQNPFNTSQIVKTVALSGEGIATSGTYTRGQHVYNPHDRSATLETIASMTVIGPNVYEADRFATAAFAMQDEGIYLIESEEGLEGYMIDRKGVATMTSGFDKYLV